MKRFGWRWMVAVLGLVTCGAGSAAGQSNVILPRPGQVGVTVGGQYGTLFRGGDLGDLFQDGAGVAVRIRYRMRYERAIGLSFESQNFASRVEGVADTSLKSLTLIMSGFDIYQMFGTNTRTTRHVSAGFGLAQARATLKDDEKIFPDDGIYVSGGLGFEHFFYRNWGYTMDAHYFAVFQHQKTNSDVQFTLGLVFYASY